MIVLSLLILLAGSTAALAISWSFVPRDIWSIGIYTGSDPLHLQPRQGVRNRPVISAATVSDVPANFVADPFMVRVGNQWHMFFEVLNARSKRGEVGHASSADGLTWSYDRIVLAEPFHLSYPQVFESNGDFFMIPETQEAGGVRLYKADSFPASWHHVGPILHGDYRDASIVFHDGRWWLFALRGAHSLTLHHAPTLAGPWEEHVCSPIAHGDITTTRPGGRILKVGERLFRFSQDGLPSYGSAVHAFEIEALTTTAYRERRIDQNPVLARGTERWNVHGMHHVDAHCLENGTWLACVDGKRITQVFRWRSGLRRVANLLPLRRRETPAARPASLL